MEAHLSNSLDSLRNIEPQLSSSVDGLRSHNSQVPQTLRRVWDHSYSFGRHFVVPLQVVEFFGMVMLDSSLNYFEFRVALYLDC